MERYCHPENKLHPPLKPKTFQELASHGHENVRLRDEEILPALAGADYSPKGFLCSEEELLAHLFMGNPSQGDCGLEPTEVGPHSP